MKGLRALYCLLVLTLPAGAQVKDAGEPKENTQYIDTLALSMGSIPEKLIKIHENIYIISPNGIAGNTGVFVGDNGVYLIDNQWSVLANRIKQLLQTITSKPIKAIINTHYHFDHTNGNIAFGAEKIPIVAHANTRLRMMAKQVIRGHVYEVQQPYPAQALPTITFTDKAEFHEGNETIELLYFKNAHTDGDAVVHFKRADIYHTGDIFVTYGLPVIDEDAGGNIFSMIEAVDTLLARADDNTRFIPGHGPLCSKKELLVYRNLLAFIRDQVMILYRKGKPLAQIIKETKDKLDPNLSGTSQEKFIAQVYRMAQSHIKSRAKRE
ncbi:MBL fold metallo-hydrolase [Spirosoma aureum]|uniref:MBL fold metallo-hydrolase n=1 Tax=Spirosoma aureum TaxID=2692134 RepID=A0A6G9AHH7_9BACT|nr:MBL fold metallo-hydrolase [Spirosoma aureum]QIP11911.1 MBL fold metallo-hydrolase [Spirosoma aureum]